jgi:hypothetical protein
LKKPAFKFEGINTAQIAKNLHEQNHLATKINTKFDNMKGMSAMTFNFNKEMPFASSFANKFKATDVATIAGNFKR